MSTLKDNKEMESENFYYTIIHKLNATLAAYHHIGEIDKCGDSFDSLDIALHSKDIQINHLLSITMCLLKQVPNSLYVDELFTNFLKDYVHLVNPEMPMHMGELYLSEEFIRKHNQDEKLSKNYKVNAYQANNLWL
ncbi:hypothetical protein [Adhaeribacter aquaticus]|uniref:hypothetical protein n=1 Tax=Adhaeribacter aquaticus TaxID=299567 RepID=UPI0005575B6F|nr:hypothetical protein [Adhaeribacter aquaticus]